VWRQTFIRSSKKRDGRRLWLCHGCRMSKKKVTCQTRRSCVTLMRLVFHRLAVCSREQALDRLTAASREVESGRGLAREGCLNGRGWRTLARQPTCFARRRQSARTNRAREANVALSRMLSRMSNGHAMFVVCNQRERAARTADPVGTGKAPGRQPGRSSWRRCIRRGVKLTV